MKTLLNLPWKSFAFWLFLYLVLSLGAQFGVTMQKRALMRAELPAEIQAVKEICSANKMFNSEQKDAPVVKTSSNNIEHLVDKRIDQMLEDPTVKEDVQAALQCRNEVQGEARANCIAWYFAGKPEE